MRRTVGIHADRQERTAKAAFVVARGEAEVLRRAAEIAALPAVEWRGRTLRTIHCCGERGRGPHLVNVPEALLWALISVDVFRCAYHA